MPKTDRAGRRPPEDRSPKFWCIIAVLLFLRYPGLPRFPDRPIALRFSSKQSCANMGIWQRSRKISATQMLWIVPVIRSPLCERMTVTEWQIDVDTLKFTEEGRPRPSGYTWAVCRSNIELRGLCWGYAAGWYWLITPATMGLRRMDRRSLSSAPSGAGWVSVFGGRCCRVWCGR
jgi:hypothetical protein